MTLFAANGGGITLLQKAEGIVIKSVDYGESNKITTLFTREFGKIGVMARGAKKTKSRLSSASQLFTCGIFLFHKSSGLGTLQQAEMTNSFKDIRADIVKTAYAAYIVELLDKCTDEKKRNPFVYEHLYQTIYLMDEGIDPQILKFIFDMKMLILLGIQPHVNGCKQCGTLENIVSFSMKESGLLCNQCTRIDPRAYKISAHAARLLRIFYYVDLNRLGNVSVKKETKIELENILDAYYEEYSGIRLKSKKFLSQIESFQTE
jgi:DNA repair protein RecO (recombination protein O)